MSDLPKRVDIHEEGPREGFQIEPGPISTADKIRLIEALAETGWGVYELALDHVEVPSELNWIRDITAKSNCTTVFNLSQTWQKPDMWRHVLELLDTAQADGLPLFAQSAGRAIGILMSWRGSAHPFMVYPSYWTHVGGKETWEEKLAALKDPAVREAILSDEAVDAGEFNNFIATGFDKMFLFDEFLDYEPDESQSVTFRAAETGKSPQEVAYDALLANDGMGFMYFPLFNYADGDLEALYAMHNHPHVRMGLSDGGAHCGAICDSGMPTFMLTHWTRDRKRGETISLEKIVHRQTRQTAELYGLLDRGLLKPGYRADINVIDYENLELAPPQMVFDLPAGGRRLTQKAAGYDDTICRGVVIVDHGETTDARPGGVIRGPQADPAN